MNLLALGGGAIAGIVIGAVAFVLIIWFIATYNSLISSSAKVEEAFSTIDVYLKKRFDLIPNLVETVKGYAKHESETFLKVTEARSKAMNAATPEEKIEADKLLTQAIRNFNVVLEKYPELKSNTNFLDLQGQLKAIESELANSRKYYNATVRIYNTQCKSFPSLIVAKMMRFETKPYFEVASPEERENVKVQF